MEPIITEEKIFNLLGCIYYGDPFHLAAPWSYENEIGLLWKRYIELAKIYKNFLNKINVNPNIGYEVHIEPKEFQDTKNFYIFVGIEVFSLEFVPLEMIIKKLPKTKYLNFTTKADDFKTCGNIYNEWLPSSEYEQSYPYIIEAYEHPRYKGLTDKESEIDWYIPIKKKNKSDNE